MNINYNKDFFALINSLIPITKQIIINKDEDNIKIIRTNPSQTIAYTLSCSKDNFSFEDDTLAFYSFGDFYKLFNVFTNPTLEIEENKLIISENKSKIKFILSDSEIMAKGPNEIEFPESDVKFDLSLNEFKNIKRMIGLLGSEFVNFKTENNNLNVRLFSSSNDNTFEKDYEVETKNDIDYKISSEIFCVLPDNDYILDISKEGIVRFKYVNEKIDLNIYAIEVED